jgi:hypothetical protein
MKTREDKKLEYLRSYPTSIGKSENRLSEFLKTKSNSLFTKKEFFVPSTGEKIVSYYFLGGCFFKRATLVG